MHMVVLFQRLRKTFGTYGGVVLRLRKTFGAYDGVNLRFRKTFGAYCAVVSEIKRDNWRI